MAHGHGVGAAGDVLGLVAGGEDGTVAVLVQVAAADAAPLDLDADLVALGLLIGDFVHPKILGGVKTRCFHEMISS